MRPAGPPAGRLPRGAHALAGARGRPRRLAAGRVPRLAAGGAAAAGQRYLLINDTGSNSTEDPGFAQAWRGTDGSTLVANTNDIVQYDGVRWNIAFDSSQETNVQYVSNLTTSVQYRWANNEWLKSYEGLYPEGEWSLVL